MACIFPLAQLLIWPKLLELVTREDELAAVLSHEVSHLLAEHYREMNSYLAVQGIMMAPLLPMLVGAFYAPRLLLTAFTVIFAQGFLQLYLQRCQEKEADYIGMLLMAEAGFDPAAATALWSKYAVFEKTTLRSYRPQINILSSHPSVSSRARLTSYH